MNNSNQSTRQNSVTFTGNVSQVKPLQSGACAISIAYNEGQMNNGQWETTDTLFLEAYIPAKHQFIPNIGDKLTVTGFLKSNNYQPQNGPRKFGVQLVIVEILDYQPKQAQQNYQQQQYSGQQQNAPRQQQQQQYAPRQQQQQQYAPRQQQQQQYAPRQQQPQQYAPRQQQPQQYAPRQPQSQYQQPSNSFEYEEGFKNH